MPPPHARSHGKASKNAACYSCVVTSSIILCAVVLCGLLYAGVLLGIRFREGEVVNVRGSDALLAPARLPTPHGSAADQPGQSHGELTDSVSALMSAAGLPLSLPASPSLVDLAGAVSAAVPMLRASREAAARGSIDALPPMPCPACPAAPAAAAGAAAGGTRPLRRVIVGMAMNIDVPNLYRFVRSARDHVPGADIVLFVDDDSGDRGAILSLFGVEARRFTKDTLPPAIRAWHPSSYRWVMVRDWMRGLSATVAAGSPPPYDLVMALDVRDSVFQGDPFAAPAAEGGPGFWAFQEARPRSIRECGWNSGWVKDCYGAEGLQRVGGEVISCSGTSVASWQAMFVYADMVSVALERPGCERNGADQGIHNYLVYGGDLAASLRGLPGGLGGGIRLVSNEEGWIATVQSMPQVVRDKAGRVLNDRGAPVAVVHQYDRSPQLLAQYDREYVWLPDAVLRLK